MSVHHNSRRSSFDRRLVGDSGRFLPPLSVDGSVKSRTSGKTRTSSKQSRRRQDKRSGHSRSTSGAKDNSKNVQRENRSGKTRSSSGSSRQSRASLGLKKDVVKRLNLVAYEKIGSLMLYYTMVTQTSTGTEEKVVSKVHMVKVTRNRIIISDELTVRFSKIKNIGRESSTQLLIEYLQKASSSPLKIDLQARNADDCSDWFNILTRCWQMKKNEQRRREQREKAERKLLEGRIDLLDIDHEILHAAHDNKCQRLKVLRRICENMNCKTSNVLERTALHIATMRGHITAVKILLTPMYERFVGSGARLRAPKWLSDYSEFLGFRRCLHQEFPCACQERKNELLSNIDNEGNSWHQYKYKYCAVVDAAYVKGDPGATIETSSKRSFQFNLRKCTVRECLEDEETKAPIFEGTGKPVLMRRRCGVDVNAADAMGWSALHLAVVRGFGNIVAHLLERGASVNQISVMGYTPLHCAAQRGRLRSMRLLLENAEGIDIVFATNRTYSTPLHFAARGGHAACVWLLCESGSDVNALDADGNSAVQFACWRNDKETIQALVKWGAAPSLA